VWVLGTTAALSADDPAAAARLAELLDRATERVQQYFARAQSLVCLETVYLQPLGPSLSPDGRSRSVESELRLSWQPSPEEPTPKEARMLRQVLKVNGRPPRKNDHENCTTPEQQSSEAQPLSMLLPEERRRYRFVMAGRRMLDGRSAVLLDYRQEGRPVVETSVVDDNEDCISFLVDGGVRGRLWIDEQTYDVLRLDQGLSGLIDIPMPREVRRRGGDYATSWTMERWDLSIRFKPVTFKEPDETLLLPESVMSLKVVRGAGTPRLRVQTRYTHYKRFLTGARVVVP
jgi:hypothetical protein